MLLAPINLFAEKVIPPGKENYLISIIKPYEVGIYDYKLENISINKDSVKYEFCKERDCFYILLTEKSKISNPVVVTKNFAISLEGVPKKVDIGPLVNVIIKNDTQNVFELIDCVDSKVLIPENIKIIYVFIILVILVLLLSLSKKTSERINEFINIAESILKRVYVILFGFIICFAAYMRYRNICIPVVEEGSIMRLLYSYDSWVYNLFISNDQRHPGLYFALLKPFVMLFKDAGFTARMVSATFSILSVAALGLILLKASCISSVLGMLILSVHPEFIHRSREVTDISLFIFASLSSIFFLINFEMSGKKRDFVLFIIFLILSCYSSYAAYVNLFAIFVYFTVNKKIRMYLKYFAVIFVFILPYLYKISSSIKDEFFTKSMAIKFQNVIWGGEPFVYFIQKSFSLLFAGDYTVFVLALLVAKIIVNYRSWSSNLLFFSIFTFNLGFILLSLIFRMMPYYFIFLPVSVVLLISYQRDVDSNLFKRLFSIISMIFLFYLFYHYLFQRFETIYVQSYHIRNNPELVSSIVKSFGVRDIVIDIENNKYSLGYYFFERPYETLIEKGCNLSYNNSELICKEDSSGRTITALTLTSSLKDGWEERALERLKGLPYERFCFIYDNNYKNLHILNYIQDNCKPISLGEKFLVYMCNR